MNILDYPQNNCWTEVPPSNRYPSPPYKKVGKDSDSFNCPNGHYHNGDLNPTLRERFANEKPCTMGWFLMFFRPIERCCCNGFIRSEEWASKTCSKCGHVQEMKLSDRVFDCQKCDNVMDRDLNASINLENAPEEKVRSARPERTDTRVCPYACGQEDADILGRSRKETPGQINKFS